LFPFKGKPHFRVCPAPGQRIKLQFLYTRISVQIPARNRNMWSLVQCDTHITAKFKSVESNHNVHKVENIWRSHSGGGRGRRSSEIRRYGFEYPKRREPQAPKHGVTPHNSRTIAHTFFCTCGHSQRSSVSVTAQSARTFRYEHSATCIAGIILNRTMDVHWALYRQMSVMLIPVFNLIPFYRYCQHDGYKNFCLSTDTIT